MRFVKASAVLAVTAASFADAAPAIPGVAELLAWKAILGDPSFNPKDYGTAVPKKFLSEQSACHLYCGTVIQFVRDRGCDSGWEEYEGKCRTCFGNAEYGAAIKQVYESGVNNAASQCPSKPDVGQPDAGQDDAEFDWVAYGHSLGLPEDVVACHAACGGIIRNGREKKCDLLRDSPDFIPRCEKCAIPKGIWETYKVGAQEGAKSCGLEVIPQ